jgi:hypothetical protein
VLAAVVLVALVVGAFALLSLPGLGGRVLGRLGGTDAGGQPVTAPTVAGARATGVVALPATPPTAVTSAPPNSTLAPLAAAPRATPAAAVGRAASTTAAVALAASPVAAALTPSVPPPGPTPVPTPLAAGPVLVDTRFAAGPQPGWIDNLPFAGWSNGAYRLQARESMRFVAVGSPLPSVPDDVIVSATFRKTGGPPGGGYGLIVRDNGPSPRDGQNQEMNAYVLEAGDLGEFGIWRRDGDHWVDLVPWTRGASVHPGGSPNELSVHASGARLVFVINGVQVAAVDDSILPSGTVGVFAGGDFNEVALDRFTVQAPE